MPDICIYHGKRYYNPRYNKKTIEIVETEGDVPIDETYHPAKDVRGNIVKGWFSKTVSYDEVDAFYSIDYIIFYKGMECGVGALGERQLTTKKVYIFIHNKELAKKYGFSKFDRNDDFFVKMINLSEVEKLIVVKTWMAGEKKGESIRWETDIMSFLENYPDNI